MSQHKHPSRRTFLAASAAVVAGSSLRGGAELLEQAMPVPTVTRPKPQWRDKGVLDLTQSPHAKLRMVPVSAVAITGGFWAERRRVNVDSSIPSMHDELIAHGRMTNFERLQGKSNEPQKGPVYSDSDIYKWIEASAFALQGGQAPKLRQTIDADVREIVAVQEPSGYLNTYYVDEHKPLRMTTHVQESGHELYNLGHYLQGAIAYYRATGDSTMLDAGIRFVDHYLLPGFGPAPKQPIVSGHPEIEMALIELYRTTGRRDYLQLAGYILQGDSRMDLKASSMRYMYCGVPFTSEQDLHGHAVRCMYACCGATDYYLETGDAAYLRTLRTLWEDLSQRQMYVTGGVGARHEGEAFGNPYELPNEQAYGESCAAIGNFMWNARLLAATGEAKFTDVMERALYNGIASGMSLDGKTYCYRNPLAFEPSTGDHIRNAWYDTTCCPPNLQRTFASLPGYCYSTAKDGVYVHLYNQSQMHWRLEDGTALSIEQQTEYPWQGTVVLTVSPAQSSEFTLHLRIPGWSAKNSVFVNGTAVSGATPGEYLPVRRRWKAGDRIELSFDMTPQLLEANPAVREDVGKLAVQRGPIVFCMEGLDQKAHPSGLNMAAFRAVRGGTTVARYEPGLLGGVMVLDHGGMVGATEASQPLYRTASEGNLQPTTITLIPYYAWSNRERSPMQVWIPYRNA